MWKGPQIEGYYDRVVTLMSTDERLFRCNQKLGFTKTTRVKISGRIDGDRVTLRETAYQAAASPCDDGARNLVAYVGVSSHLHSKPVRIDPQTITDFLKWENRLARYNGGTLPTGIEDPSVANEYLQL